MKQPQLQQLLPPPTWDKHSEVLKEELEVTEFDKRDQTNIELLNVSVNILPLFYWYKNIYLPHEGRPGEGEGGRSGVGTRSPLLGPDAPVPESPACRPAGEPRGQRHTRPRGAAVPPGGLGVPQGRGEARVREVGCGRRGARRPRPSPHPHPAPHPHPGPRRPRRSPCSGPGRTRVRPPAVAACGRPRGPQVPSPRHPGTDPSHPSILCPGPGAGRRIPGLTSERRWQWTRKLGCCCYCSPLGSGESLSLSSKRAKKAGLPGLHKKRQQPPTAPLQALRGHNTREPLLCPPKRQLSYHLGGRGKGGRGEKCTRSR
ncbi:uncharacterized protein LOC119064321 [Artibeus jamaicensis]|uniref:uncharacterized protein LOC119064321 n=1 Tax=Artibeus jamaicensis TaxID=9417 RepID=UPI00235B0667|nr:uncharacterized protein LOC119064321 [Artibeus jamaicensis]